MYVGIRSDVETVHNATGKGYYDGGGEPHGRGPGHRRKEERYSHINIIAMCRQ